MFVSVMDNSLLEYIGIDPAFYVIGLLAIVVILFIIFIVQQCKIGKLRKRLDAFMISEKTDAFEDVINQKFEDIKMLKEVQETHSKEIKQIEDFMKVTYSKIGLVKYDAFREMGGNMSFVLCLLTDKNDGFLLNSMHSREGCYTYIKEIIKGESYIELSEEEKDALNTAVNMRNYMDK